MSQSIYLWVGFNAFVLVMLALDLGIFNRQDHVITFKEALRRSALWIGLALAFAGIVYAWRGSEIGLQFLTGYLIEESLSVDNLFVMLLIFAFFRVPATYQHKVLFWGILGALLLRAIFIVTGVALIEKFHWMIYLFGALLIFTGIKMALEKDKKIHPEHNPVLQLFRRLMPVTQDYVGSNFFVLRDGKRWATPLLVVLVLIETTDVIFAVDSVPAILSVSRDPFIVYTSNVFAILGLRSLYFALAGMMHRFHYLSYGLAVILLFVGGKMLLTDVVKVPIAVALCVVMGVLLIAIVASLLTTAPQAEEQSLPSVPAAASAQPVCRESVNTERKATPTLRMEQGMHRNENINERKHHELSSL
ncbi:MAG TPA: TerC family protein [Armatimonadota bacterium]|jgi:tellurite resistance protein TerC